MATSIRNIENKTELDRMLNKDFTNPYRTGYVEVGEDNVCLPVYYKDYEERIRKFEVRDDDVFLAGLAKTGTAWCMEMVWLIVNNLDYEGAKEQNILRCPILEMSCLHDFRIMKIEAFNAVEPMTYVENLKSPRCIKSHLHWSLWPEQIRNGSKQPKIISIFRNPKDTCVSHYHQAKLSAGYKGTFEDFSQLYLGGRVPYGPYWKYVLSFWGQRHRPNILFIKYEEMKADLPAVIKKVSAFLGKPLKGAEIASVIEHLSFEAMKKNPATNLKDLFKKLDEKYHITTEKNDYIRAGKVGGHAGIMTPEISAKFDAWTTENLTGTDFSF